VRAPVPGVAPAMGEAAGLGLAVRVSWAGCLGEASTIRVGWANRTV
jgi:hypothetical protein